MPRVSDGGLLRLLVVAQVVGGALLLEAKTPPLARFLLVAACYVLGESR